jgi:hypothetical protein
MLDDTARAITLAIFRFCMCIGMMNDVADPPEPAQSLKRPLDVEQVNSAATNAHQVEANGVNGADGIHHEASHSGEPAAKRLRLENGEQEAQSDKVDARNKVKGVALLKEE